MATSMHALRDKWLVSFLPLLTADIVNTEFKGDWNLAAQERMQKLDWITTVEETWSTVNSLPKLQQLGFGSTFIFSRSGKVPSYETFPEGSRVVLNLFKTPAPEKGLEIVVSCVLGEAIAEQLSEGKPVCDVIRVAARPNREHSELVRLEVWLNDSSYSAAVVTFLKNTFKQHGLSSNLYTIAENPFDTPLQKSKSSTQFSSASPESSTR